MFTRKKLDKLEENKMRFNPEEQPDEPEEKIQSPKDEPDFYPE